MKTFLSNAKKFFAKLPVMIVAVVIAVAGLAIYIGLLARPVSTGMAYSFTQTLTEEDGVQGGATIEYKIIFNGNKANIVYSYEAGEEKGEQESGEIWTLRNGNKILLLTSSQDMTQEEYDTGVAELKSDKEVWDAIWAGELNASDAAVMKIDAFKLSTFGETSSLDGLDELTCDGAVIFAAVFGVFEVLFLAAAGLSVALYVIGKGKAPKEEQPKQEA